MKRLLTALFALAICLNAHAFITIKFPSFFYGSSIGVKGDFNLDSNLGGAVYGEFSFMIATVGMELGYNRFEHHGIKSDYKYLTPYIGLQWFPVDEGSIYVNAGWPILLGNDKDVRYGDKVAFSVEAGYKHTFKDDSFALGIGYKWHWLEDIRYQADKFKHSGQMVFINAAIFWNLQ